MARRALWQAAKRTHALERPVAPAREGRAASIASKAGPRWVGDWHRVRREARGPRGACVGAGTWRPQAVTRPGSAARRAAQRALPWAGQEGERERTGTLTPASKSSGHPQSQARSPVAPAAPGPRRGPASLRAGRCHCRAPGALCPGAPCDRASASPCTLGPEESVSSGLAVDRGTVLWFPWASGARLSQGQQGWWPVGLAASRAWVRKQRGHGHLHSRRGRGLLRRR